MAPKRPAFLWLAWVPAMLNPALQDAVAGAADGLDGRGPR